MSKNAEVFFWVWGLVSPLLIAAAFVLYGMRKISNRPGDEHHITIAVVAAVVWPLFVALAFVTAGVWSFGTLTVGLGRWLARPRAAPTNKTVIKIGEGPHRSVRICGLCGQRMREELP